METVVYPGRSLPVDRTQRRVALLLVLAKMALS
jgi:hypothetical protein